MPRALEFFVEKKTGPNITGLTLARLGSLFGLGGGVGLARFWPDQVT